MQIKEIPVKIGKIKPKKDNFRKIVARLKIQLDPKLQASLKDASRKLTGVKKRAFIAQATQDYFNSSPRQAETYMGWSRKAVEKGLKELETGRVCQDNNQEKGNKKTEKKPSTRRRYSFFGGC